MKPRGGVCNAWRDEQGQIREKERAIERAKHLRNIAIGHDISELHVPLHRHDARLAAGALSTTFMKNWAFLLTTALLIIFTGQNADINMLDMVSYACLSP